MPCNYSLYPSNWKTEIRPRILSRDNHHCKFCTVPNYSYIHRFGKGIDDWKFWPEGMESEAWTADGLKATRIVLTIAHLDHDKNNNDDRNLAALCQRCHIRHDLDQHKASSRATNEMKKKQQKLF
jgi:5-methylcytosine-specific restriction endonuclease McrA